MTVNADDEEAQDSYYYTTEEVCFYPEKNR